MGCGCRKKEMLRRTGDKGLEHITKLAIGFSKALQKDVDIYIEALYNKENLYNFAIIDTIKNKKIVKTIIYDNGRS